VGGYELRAVALFDGLDDDQLGQLAAAGEQVPFGAGDELFGQARPADHWWVLLAGSISLVRRVGHEETPMAVMDSPGQWAGGFRAWDPTGVYLATGRATTPGCVLRVPAPALRALADAWFPFGMHFIHGLVGTVRRIESMARQREALVALGTLAAGFAHEINNPAAAATRAAGALQDAAAALSASFGRLAQAELPADRLAALDALRREIAPAADESPLAVADREDALSDWLARHGVERDWAIAPALAAAGVDVDWCDRAALLLGPGAGGVAGPGIVAGAEAGSGVGGGVVGAGLEWVASSLTLSALLAEVRESTGRVSDLVGVMRSYSQVDRASLQWIDVAEGLESTLVMLAGRLRDGVHVVRDYGGDVPRIEAYAGELNQVWTHLIGNAVDAMGGAGTLRVSIRPAGDGVRVEIADTGPGMTDEVRAHAFEPFFTTKGVGEGSGLGLDVSRRVVVERHGGDITIDSRPGGTTLHVLLPARAGGRP
jgi:signal transduction histidine kinase